MPVILYWKISINNLANEWEKQNIGYKKIVNNLRLLFNGDQIPFKNGAKPKSLWVGKFKLFKMNVASKIIGIIALIIMIVGLVPFLGILNWIVVPIALIGLIIGVFSKNTGGLILNGIVLLVSILRLIIGGGII